METKPKKILFVITKSNWGGAQRYVYDLATHLPKDQFEVSVAFGGVGRLKTELEAKQIRTIKLPYLERDVRFLKDLFVFFNLYRLFRKERPHSVHVNSSKIGGIGALAGKLARVPQTIFTVHGFAFNEKRPSYEKTLIKFLSWLSVFLSDTTIVISEVEFSIAKKWLGVRKKITLIRNGIIPLVFQDKKSAQTELLTLIGKPADFFNGKKIIGTIAELTENKGLSYAIEAMKKIPDSLFLIIGGGEKETELKKAVNENNLQEKVSFAGFVENASRLIKGFDVFLLPSIKEGLPYVLLEAGFAEVPIIATKVGGIPELLRSDENGVLVRPRDPKDIEMGIRFINENPKKQKEFTEKLRKTIDQDFSFETMLEKHKNLYKRK